MKLLGYILLACLVIAALQWAVLALVIAATIGFLIAIITKPKATLGALALSACFALVSAFPWLLLVFSALAIVAKIKQG